MQRMVRAAFLATLLMGGAAMAAENSASPNGSGKGDRLVGLPHSGRSEVIAQHGMAATSQPLATQVALDILKRGGSAVDAAIAANAALGLMEPTGSGMGGDLFALVWDPKAKKLYGYNGSGRAPLGQTLEQLKARLGSRTAIPSFGALSVSVPGAVDGWFALHGRFGRLPIRDVLAPAIAYARDGFPLSPYIAQGWAGNVRRLLASPDVEEKDNLRATFSRDGKTPEAGQIWRNPDLAASLTKLAEGGRDAYYKGDIARTIDAYMKRIGGPLRYEDLAAHQGEWVEPISTSYRGYQVWELPPNTQGLAVLQMLNILEGYDLKAMGHNSADHLHVMVEAKKLAFADRARFYADPAFARIPLAELLSKEYAAERRHRIDMKHASKEVPSGDALLRSDTIYLTTADADGMMVSLIQSNYRGLGSGLVPDRLGFMLQDRGELFALDPAHANVYAPGKRPFHTIIPGFVTKDGDRFLSFGVMGGAMQPQGHTQVLINLIDFAMNVQEAGDAARYQHDGSQEPTGTTMTNGGELWLEGGVRPDVLAELRRRGHDAKLVPGTHYGSYEAILWDKVHGVYHGGTEMRVDGQAAGY